MFLDLHVQRYRGVTTAKLDELGRINILLGKNNSGKTALLEAAMLLAKPYEAGPSLVQVMRARGYPEEMEVVEGDPLRRGGPWLRTKALPESAWKALFQGSDLSLPIDLAAREPWPSDGDPGREPTLTREVRLTAKTWSHAAGTAPAYAAQQIERVGPIKVSYSRVGSKSKNTYRSESGSHETLGAGSSDTQSPSGNAITPVPAVFIEARRAPTLNEDTAELGRRIVAKREERVVSALREVDPRLLRLVPVPEQSGIALFADIGARELLPLPSLGDGMLRMFTLALHLTSAAGGLLLVDEVENGFHYSVLPKLWSLLGRNAISDNIQILATTHSVECVEAAYLALRDAKALDQISVFRLDRTDGEIKAVRYHGDLLEAAIESRFELR